MVVFSDGFESGDFSAWTSQPFTAGDTAAVEALHVHHGSFNALFTTDGSGASEYAYTYKTIGAIATVYGRAYFKILTAFPAAAQTYRLLQFGVGSTFVAMVLLLNDGGVMKWQLGWHNGAAHTYTSYTPAIAIALNTWYCIELKVVISAVAGEYRVYIDGVEVITQTGKDSDEHGNITRFGIGEIMSTGTTAHSIVTDCAVVDSAYIGPEAAGEAKPELMMLGVGLQAKLPAFKPRRVCPFKFPLKVGL
jgi:hypothetical protein